MPLGTGESWFRRPPYYGAGKEISIRVTAEAVEIGVSRADTTVTVAHKGGEVDVTGLAGALARLKAEHFAGSTWIDIAGLDAVPYGKVADAIDAARGAGFTDWFLVGPGDLAAAGALP